MFTGSQFLGQTQEWPQFPVHPPSKSIYKYLSCEGACIPFPPKWPTFPRSSFHLKVGPLSPRPRLLMLVPDLSLLVFRPHQLLHSSGTLLFCWASSLPPPSPATFQMWKLHWLTLPVLTYLLASVSFSLTCFQPLYCNVRSPKTLFLAAKYQRHPWRARPPLLRKWSESESAAFG